MTPDEHLNLLKQAIESNLTARIKHDQQQQREKPTELKCFCAADLLDIPEEKLYLESIINDPVRKALKNQLKDLGQNLFRLLGSTAAMLKVAQEVAKSDWDNRIDIIDKTWDGIGAENDYWVA